MLIDPHRPSPIIIDKLAIINDNGKLINICCLRHGACSADSMIISSWLVRHGDLNLLWMWKISYSEAFCVLCSRENQPDPAEGALAGTQTSREEGRQKFEHVCCQQPLYSLTWDFSEEITCTA